MAEKTVAAVVEAGITANMTAANSGGDFFANDGKTMLRVTNAHATLSRTITFDVPNTDNFGVSGAALDRAVVVAALTTMLIGPFMTAKFNDGNGNVQMTYSSEADLTMQALRVNAVT
jgi:hypothetical protein